MKHLKNTMILVWFLLMLTFGETVFAESEWTVTTENQTGKSMSFVSYPVFDSLENPEISKKINETILSSARVQEYINLMTSVEEGTTGIQMDFRMNPDKNIEDYASFVFSARGKMLQGPPAQMYYGFTVNMSTGEKVSAEEIFKEGAASFLENYMEETVAPTLSTYLENSDLLPVPMDHFALDETGITFFYPIRQLSFLSGFSGAVTVPYYELSEVLELEEGSVLQKIGIAPFEPNENTKEKITASATQGMLLGLPVKIGGSLEEVLNMYQCTVDEGYYPAGAYYELEDSRFRDTVLLTDDLSEEVLGLYTRRFNLAGIITGKTTREEWQKVLGEPSFSMEMGEEDGEKYLLCAGTSDFYDLDDAELMLHGDENGVLYAIVIRK